MRLLARRRLTEAQLWSRLTAKGYDEDRAAETVAYCKRQGFLDDALYAQLFVEGRDRFVGDARLVAELVRRGIARDAAVRTVARCSRNEGQRLGEAFTKLLRTRPGLGYPSAARALERLGFPAPAIYRFLREHANEHGPFGRAEDYAAASP